MATLAEPIVLGKQVVSQLKTNTLNLFDATIIATSSVAPAYSLAATIAVLRRPRPSSSASSPSCSSRSPTTT
jgi:hypothetical protein